MTDMKSHALELAGVYGFCVFPVTAPSHYGSAPGKRPLIKEWPQLATTDPQQIEAWWSRWPEANIGVATGRPSNIWVLDVDMKSGGPDGLSTLRKLEQEMGPFPDTLTAITGSGGLHLYFRYDPEAPVRSRADVLPGIDVRGDGGYVVAPPSLHVSGSRYKWKN